MKAQFFLYGLILMLLLSCAEHQHEVESVNIEARVDSVFQLMTLQEKIGQLIQFSGNEELTGPDSKTPNELELINKIKAGNVGAMLNVVGVANVREIQRMAVEESRLGIPLLFGYDVIHGFKTMFPIPLGETASWEPELAKATAAMAAYEAAASGINWTFAPMVDISRDARWGRVMEGAGEDPFLSGAFSAARVRGFQGEDLADPLTVAACAKHFAGYGYAEGGRDYNTTEINTSTLHNVVLPPFKACVDAGVATVMNAFNLVDGIPATAHAGLQREVLKKQWGFEGFVVSDWNSIGEMVAHGVAENKKHAALLAMTAGSDMDMEGDCYAPHMLELVQEGKINVAEVEDAVRRILRVKFRLGLFDDPYLYCVEEREGNPAMQQQAEALALKAAQKSIVLLKNEKQLLPLKPGQKVGLIGQLADDKDTPLGSWSAHAVEQSAVSLYEGLQQGDHQLSVRYARGPQVFDQNTSFFKPVIFNQDNPVGMEAAIEVARQSDVVVLAMGESRFQSGEARSQMDIGFKGLQLELFEAVRRVNPNVVVVLMNGRPLDLSAIADKAAAILECWHLGSKSGTAIASVLTGEFNPGGKLPISFPRSVGQVPIYYARTNTGRPTGNESVLFSQYIDGRNDALYPFGHGLSYTSFQLDALELSQSEINAQEQIKISVNVTNTGAVAGTEVVQLYIQDVVASSARPVKELKGFKKVWLEAGAAQQVTFEIDAQALAFYTPEGLWKSEPGVFRLWVGNSAVGGLEGQFKLI
ncbi:beta-glucosidase BglX [Persicobacter diffluens]|uniref:beta-glucosidase n=1 Tax=Persicobacter diffluens TaxID=981 RepID=A0AAN5AN31_9BACT|nr:glycosyl hydrolase [Persicobacter diffluens]